MSTVTIGRAGILGEAGVASVTLGKTIRISGDLHVSDVTDLTYAAEQFAAYVDNPDESFVPVQWSAGPSGMNGYYRVLSVDLMSQRPELWSLGMELERVHGFAAPLMESVLVGGFRPSSDVVASPGAAWHAIPAAATGYETGVLTPTTTVLHSETGDLNYFTEATNSLYNARPSWYISPADWYDGAASLTVGGKLVTGRQCQNLPTDWTLSNGLVRFSGSTAGLVSELWTSTTSEWVAPGSWKIGRKVGAPGAYTVDPLLAPHALTILRNDPACVTIRLAYDAAAIVAGSRFVVYVDVSLRRGAKVAEITLGTRGAYEWGVIAPVAFGSLTTGYDSGADGTFITCGINEFGGVPVTGGTYWIATYAGSGRQFDQWGFGYRAGHTQQWAAQQYAAVQSERTQVVAR